MNSLETTSNSTEFTFEDGDSIQYFLQKESLNTPLETLENKLDLHPIEDLELLVHDFAKTRGETFYNAYLSWRRHSSMDSEHLLLEIFGENTLMFFGYYMTEPESGKWGDGEVSDKVRVSFINGILTNTPSLIENLRQLSESHGGVNIHYVYRPSKGWSWDLFQSLAVHFGHTSSHAIRLAEEWEKMIDDMGGVEGGGKIIHYAHSIGTMETLRALELLSPDKRKMISVYAFGSPSLFTDVPEIQHYASIRDGVSILIDFPSFLKAYQNPDNPVYFSGSFYGTPLADHIFTCETYQTIWSGMGRTFVERYGKVEGHRNTGDRIQETEVGINK